MKTPPMLRDEIVSRREDIVARWGAWTADNVRLAESVYTISEQAAGHHARVRRAMQHLRDLAGGTVSGLRVLDLGCGEGGLALELGRHGAEVVGLDGRLGQIEKAEFVREVLDVRSVSFTRADVRHLSVEDHGFFDIVVALSILDHLDAADLFDVAKRIGAVCKRFALVEVQLVAKPRATREHEGVSYRGAPRQEHRANSSRAERLAASAKSLDNVHSFVLTRASMLRLLARSSFTSVAELLDPAVGESDAPWFAAFRGRRVALATAPQANADPAAEWPEPKAAPRIGRLLRRPKR
jgi:ubiquinone/menaquinone biosynthesis C-methylase UbiE